MKKTYIFLAIAAIAVLAVYMLLPKREFREVMFPVTEGTSIDKYDDKSDGGSSEADLKLADSSVSFSCTLGMDTAQPAWCGLLWNFDPENKKNYRNWTFVDTVFIDVESSGTDGIIVKVWTYDPDVTDVGNPATFKLLLKEVPLKSGENRVAVPMEHFYTPDFWYGTAGVDTKYNKRHQENVARVEIVPGWKHPRGKPFTVVVKNFTAVGVSNLYFGIVLAVFILLTIIAVGLRHKTGRNEDKE